MTGSVPAGSRQPRGRAVQAAAVGVAAGIVGVGISRAAFGASAAPVGIVIGAAALLCGALLSWKLPSRRRPAVSSGIPSGLRLRRRVHPVAWLSPVTGSILTMAAWGAVAHSSGSGWVQAVGALLGAFLAVGLVAPAVPASGARVACTVAPSDATAGRSMTITVETDRPVRVRPIYPRGPDHQSGGRQRGPRSVRLEVTPGRRGVLDTVVVEVGSSAPFGMLWWARELELPLPHLVHVAPRTGLSEEAVDAGDDRPGDAAPRVPAGIGEPRGIRPYAPGDSRRMVHWPATSHAGLLMVRESERPTDDPVFIDLDLPVDPLAAESEAERVMARRLDVPRPQPTPGARHPRGRGAGGPPRDRPTRPGAPSGPGGTVVTLWQRFVEVNRPGPPEHSVSFRAASVAAVLLGIGACWSEGLLSPRVTVFAVVATVVGNVVAYRRRADPWPGVKPVLALCAVGGFVWFILTVTRHATPGDIATVEGPLAVLFAWVLSTHAFDVPSRRDVTYSLAGSTALIAVAAAQSVDLTLGGWVLAWVACCVWGLVAMWQSLSETEGVPWRPLVAAGALVAVVAVLLVGILPAPKVSTSLIFTASSSDASPVDNPTNLSEASGALPAHAASASGRTGVGGYLGFAHSLDTGDRVSLGNEVIMRVRATRPNYWVGQTFDLWNGQSWIQSADPVGARGSERLTGGSPFAVPTFPDQLADQSSGQEDIQTFYVTTGGPNLVFHADNVQRVYIQARSLLVTPDGTIASSLSMGPGSVYTVVSNDTGATPAELRAATAPTPGGGVVGQDPLDSAETARYLQLPHPDARVTTLARQVTAGIGAPGDTDPHTYDKVAAIERWMSDHVRYTTDIPPLPAGADAVDSFLFGTRRGYCEQISTATVVMLRSLGIPAREAVGYVPGPYDPITDLYDIQAKDAHAWVQVWFPGYGWQNFDPTATVPLANPAPGSVLAGSIGRALGRLPWVPIGVAVVLVTVVVLARRRRSRRPATWMLQVADDLGRGGVRLGCPRRTDETLSAYGQRLALAAPEHGSGLVAVTLLVERAAYGAVEPTGDQIAAALAWTHRFRSVPKRRGGRDGTPDPPGPTARPVLSPTAH